MRRNYLQYHKALELQLQCINSPGSAVWFVWRETACRDVITSKTMTTFVTYSLLRQMRVDMITSCTTSPPLAFCGISCAYSTSQTVNEDTVKKRRSRSAESPT